MTRLIDADELIEAFKRNYDRYDVITLKQVCDNIRDFTEDCWIEGVMYETHQKPSQT